MLKINKKVEYALIVLKFMLEDKAAGELTSAREICDRFGTPFDTTAKVMQIMNTQGILNSVKGTKGGYALVKDLASVSYMELVRMIEMRPYSNPCQSANGSCELLGHCCIVGPVNQLNRALTAYLERLSLWELLVGRPIEMVRQGALDLERAER